MNKLIALGTSLSLFLILAYSGNYNIQKMHSGGLYRTEEVYKNLGPVIYYEEGVYSTITVREIIGTAKALFINGKVQGSYGIPDLRVKMLLAYLPKLIRPAMQNALVIGLGTGTTSGQMSQFSKTTTIEIEPKIIGSSDFFKTFNLNVLENPDHNLIIDDGRNFLLTHHDRYDVIIPEPSEPWQSLSTALFAKEFLELASQHLAEDGLYIHWVPIYHMSPDDFKNFYKTFSNVFPHNAAFANIKPDEDTPVQFGTSEIILVGAKKELTLSEDTFRENYDNLPDISKYHLSQLRLASGNEVYHLLLFTDRQIKGYADNSELITDDRPILEFSTAKNVFTPNPEAVLEDINKFLEGKK